MPEAAVAAMGTEALAALLVHPRAYAMGLRTREIAVLARGGTARVRVSEHAVASVNHTDIAGRVVHVGGATLQTAQSIGSAAVIELGVGAPSRCAKMRMYQLSADIA